MAQPTLLKELNKITHGLGQTGETFDPNAAHTALGIGREGVLISSGSRVALDDSTETQLPIQLQGAPIENQGDNAIILPQGMAYLVCGLFFFHSGPLNGGYLRAHLLDSSLKTGYAACISGPFDRYGNKYGAFSFCCSGQRRETITAWVASDIGSSAAVGGVMLFAYSLGTTATGAE